MTTGIPTHQQQHKDNPVCPASLSDKLSVE